VKLGEEPVFAGFDGVFGLLLASLYEAGGSLLALRDQARDQRCKPDAVFFVELHSMRLLFLTLLSCLVQKGSATVSFRCGRGVPAYLGAL
jgi:uncharacterized membrane protein YhfC